MCRTTPSCTRKLNFPPSLSFWVKKLASIFAWKKMRKCNLLISHGRVTVGCIRLILYLHNERQHWVTLFTPDDPARFLCGKCQEIFCCKIRIIHRKLQLYNGQGLRAAWALTPYPIAPNPFSVSWEDFKFHIQFASFALKSNLVTPFVLG